MIRYLNRHLGLRSTMDTVAVGCAVCCFAVVAAVAAEKVAATVAVVHSYH